MPVHEARLYQRRGEVVECGLCNHRCSIPEGGTGLCGVRKNSDGRLMTLIYGEVVAWHVDPVEKKPLFHVLPGSRSLSIATKGCNFRCRHCQNFSISQVAGSDMAELLGTVRRPDDVVQAAIADGCGSVSYTYVEPTIFFEFACDCMAACHGAGLKNIFVSNGYMTREATKILALHLDAINIDIKSFRDEIYRKICGARLAPVLETVSLMKSLNIWVEITTLLIPGVNDSEEELRDIARFIYSVSPDIPWHITGFYPTYKMTDRSPTTAAMLKRAEQIGMGEGLHFVYRGNMAGRGGENTSCPACGLLIVERHGFAVQKNRLKRGSCPHCGVAIAGIW